MEDYPEPNEGWLQYFRRKRQFSDCILFAWSEIEFNIDQIVVRQFGLSIDIELDIDPKVAKKVGLFSDYKKAKILLDLNFNTKLDFLNKINVITNNERKIINKFQEYRNELFHGEHPFFFNISDKEKDEIMDNAVNAAELTRDIGFRKAD